MVLLCRRAPVAFIAPARCIPYGTVAFGLQSRQLHLMLINLISKTSFQRSAIIVQKECPGIQAWWSQTETTIYLGPFGADIGRWFGLATHTDYQTSLPPASARREDSISLTSSVFHRPALAAIGLLWQPRVSTACEFASIASL